MASTQQLLRVTHPHIFCVEIAGVWVIVHTVSVFAGGQRSMRCTGMWSSINYRAVQWLWGRQASGVNVQVAQLLVGCNNLSPRSPSPARNSSRTAPALPSDHIRYAPSPFLSPSLVVCQSFATASSVFSLFSLVRCLSTPANSWSVHWPHKTRRNRVDRVLTPIQMLGRILVALGASAIASAFNFDAGTPSECGDLTVTWSGESIQQF